MTKLGCPILMDWKSRIWELDLSLASWLILIFFEKSMSTISFLTFQKFSNKEDALMLKEHLEKDGIQTLLEDSSPSVDITFSGNTHENEYLLKVKKEEFEKAHAVLEKQAEAIVDQFPADHYLFEFSDAELYELIEKWDEWSKEDYLLSVKILKERGHDISEQKIRELQYKRIAALREPVPGKPGWIIFGYITAFAGGIIGLLIGWTHWRSTKLDPAGNRCYVYDEKTRKSGRTIFWIAVVFSTLFSLLYLAVEVGKYQWQ